MDPTVAAEARERVTKWIEETRQLFTLLPELLATDSYVSEQVKRTETEISKLRKEVEELRKENGQLRSEKDEIAQAMGQIAQKLGLAQKKSPFERTAGAEPPKVGEPPKSAELPKV